MDENTRQHLLSKNQKLINMVIERAKRDFPDDIALIGLSGSFNTGDFHRYSDLDLIIVNNTGRGWQISDCFIFDDVGYDVYCTPWERLERKAELKDYDISTLTRMRILYCAKPEYLDRFNTLKQKALDALANPIGEQCINMASEHIGFAKQNYADMILADDLQTVRYASSSLMFNLINAIVRLNNTCIQRGTKRYLEELSSYEYLPKDFKALYMAVVDAKTIEEIKDASGKFLSAIVKLQGDMRAKFVKPPTPTFESLKGTYEEAWCNLRNKVLASVGAKDKSYVFFVANGVQDYFDEMTYDLCGTKKFDLMKHFDSDNLDRFQEAFLEAMNEYLLEYGKVGRKVRQFETFEELYTSYNEGGWSTC